MVGWRRNARTGSSRRATCEPDHARAGPRTATAPRSKADKPTPRAARTTDNPAAGLPQRQHHRRAGVQGGDLQSGSGLEEEALQDRTEPRQERHGTVGSGTGAARRSAGARPARLLHAEDRRRLGVLELLAALAAADEDLGAHVLTPFETLVSFAPWEQGRASAADLGSDTATGCVTGMCRTRPLGAAHIRRTAETLASKDGGPWAQIMTIQSACGANGPATERK